MNVGIRRRGILIGVATGTSSGTRGGIDVGNEEGALCEANSCAAGSSVRVAVPPLVVDLVGSGPGQRDKWY